MSDLLTADDLKTARATKEPDRWRNWWRAPFHTYTVCLVTHVSTPRAPGDVFGSLMTQPTKAEAERHAHRAIRESERENGPGLALEYLGAFPAEESP